MKTYSVKEVAVIKGVTEETVRRWARTGKLIGTCSSKKAGWRFTERDISLVKSKETPVINEELLVIEEEIRVLNKIIDDYITQVRTLEEKHAKLIRKLGESN